MSEPVPLGPYEPGPGPQQPVPSTAPGPLQPYSAGVPPVGPGPYPYAMSPTHAASPPVPAGPLPLEPREYHHMLRTPRARWWKGLLAIVSFLAAYLIVSLILQLGAIGIDVASGRTAAADLAAGKITVTPMVLLSVNLTNAASIPIAMLLQWGYFGQRPRWLHSVRGVFRWRLLARSCLIVLPLWIVYVVAISLLSAPDAGAALTRESAAFLVIVVLTTPLQAAGEEYGARGLLSRSAASWVADPRLALLIGTAVSAVIFTVSHGAGDPWLIAYYFVFGVGLSLIVWRTGGLEVAVLIHTVNNFLLFVITILSGGDLSQSFDRSAGVGDAGMLVPMAMMAATVTVIWWWARRHGVHRVFEPPAVNDAAPGPA